ncbi:hypothetical protein [Streptomyces mirabilis]|uniref:hypothetical protein n=1 Tax=Streptomyces mirabilis TaxID=68239 RepID=UPI00116047B1|nr:hypothetical protein [Streptomyces mirabilis]
MKRTGGNTGTALRADSTGPPAPAVGLKVLAWRLSARAARAAVEVSRLAVEAGKQAPGLAAAQN